MYGNEATLAGYRYLFYMWNRYFLAYEDRTEEEEVYEAWIYKIMAS